MFQQDNDPKHIPKLVVELMKHNNIKLKTDLKPFENMWTVPGNTDV